MRYFPVHIHSDYSNAQLGFRDCVNTIDSLIAKHKKMGCEGVMLTDHGGMSGHVALEEACKNAGMKAVFGNEIYLVAEGLTGGSFERGARFNHFVLVAKNRKGWEQLNELSTLAQSRMFVNAVKRIPNYLSDLARVINAGGQNLIATTACLGGLLNPLIQEFHRTKSEEVKNEIVSRIKYLEGLFGKGNFYLEIQPALYEEQRIYNGWLGTFSQLTGVPLIVGVDAHYIEKDDFDIHKAYLNSQDGKPRETEDFYKYTYLMEYEELREHLLQSESLTEEMVDSAIANTLVVFEKCEQFSISSPLVVPKTTPPPVEEWFAIPSNYKDIPEYEKFITSAEVDDRYFISQVVKGLEKFIESGELDRKEATQRIAVELDIVWEVTSKIHSSLSRYFTTMQKILEIIWRVSIAAPGRGSAAGFLINYVMEITAVNPLKYGLEEWRFLHESRPELPDVD